ncbi:hypothetical protein ASF13_10940 [Erwinia sp. Leaf53]|nr:hypothetical protein ASF13_10940 [Erwinia sp. Leaf53]
MISQGIIRVSLLSMAGADAMAHCLPLFSEQPKDAKRGGRWIGFVEGISGDVYQPDCRISGGVQLPR